MFLAGGGISLLTGLDAALMLAGLPRPVTASHLPGVHPMVMVLGFLGTVISLERAQALRRPWGYLAPLLLGAGGISLAVGQLLLGRLLLLDGVVLLVVVYGALWRRAPLPQVSAQLAGAVLAACAALLWLRIQISATTGMLAGFVVLTIAAERVELAALALGRAAGRILSGVSVGVLAAGVASILWPAVGLRLLGLTLALTAGWLLRDDVGRRLIRSEGLRRYNAAALIAGYCWLALAGLVWMIGAAPGEATYDIVIHATFVGFGVSMVMAHAPIVLPTVIGRPLPYRPLLWLPLGLLHLAMLLRACGAVVNHRLWQVGVAITAAAMMLFLLTAVGVVIGHGRA